MALASKCRATSFGTLKEIKSPSPSTCVQAKRIRPATNEYSMLYKRNKYFSENYFHGIRKPSVRAFSALSQKNNTNALKDGDNADSRAFAIACAAKIDDVKCQDLLVLHVAPLVSWCSYMVFGTVFSRPQLLAALGRLEELAESEEWGRDQRNVPGSSPWECLDFGDVVVHLFTAEQREIYDLEGFYAAAEEVELPLGPGAIKAKQQEPRWTS